MAVLKKKIILGKFSYSLNVFPGKLLFSKKICETEPLYWDQEIKKNEFHKDKFTFTHEW